MSDTSFVGKGYQNMAALKQFCLSSKQARKKKMKAEELEEYDRAGLIALAAKFNQLDLEEEAPKKKKGKGKKKSKGKKKHSYADADKDSDQEETEEDADATEEDADEQEEADEKEEEKPFRVYIGAYAARGKHPKHAPAAKPKKPKKKMASKYSTAEGEGKLFLSSDSEQEVDATSASETYKRKNTKKRATKKGKGRK
jgi:hypothetical protein